MVSAFRIHVAAHLERPFVVDGHVLECPPAWHLTWHHEWKNGHCPPAIVVCLHNGRNYDNKLTRAEETTRSKTLTDSAERPMDVQTRKTSVQPALKSDTIVLGPRCEVTRV